MYTRSFYEGGARSSGGFTVNYTARYMQLFSITSLNRKVHKTWALGNQFYCLLIRHNEVKEFAACLLLEVCHDVGVEPALQLLSGKTLSGATANTEDEACLVEISEKGFWGSRNGRAFFDVCIFNPYNIWIKIHIHYIPPQTGNSFRAALTRNRKV